MAKLYFDTNIYSFLCATNEIAQVTRLLVEHSCVLVASAGNLFEMYAIESHEQQRREVRALVELADEFERYPESWWHALELRREIKRLRPKWLRPVASKRRARHFLKTHQERWQDAKRGVPRSGNAYAEYKRDFEQGVDQAGNAQKWLRQDMLKRKSDFTLVGPNGTATPVSVTDPEVYWRVECLQVWYNAIEEKNPASRDYADWLGTDLRPGRFRDESYPSFWLSEVANDAMPLNRLVGLVDFYQLQKKISHGNAADQLHAGHWFRSDLFVTADRAFHDVLTEVRSRHYPERPLPVLAERSAVSFVSQLKAFLSERGIV